ncbi:hypothetical protein [Streptomyces sp. NPDC094032]|uniref:hypothetical protein n=1 Tax=Streptomyces sp. NPDC094032 TaxID=3155308 RepID=UPI00332FBE61
MSWDQAALFVLASFGCLTLLLTQISEVLTRVPPIIRAWRRVRNELRRGIHERPAAGRPDRGEPAEDTEAEEVTARREESRGE